MRTFRLYLISVAGFTVLVMLVNYVLDPLCFYRMPKLYEPQYSTNARFQLPGLIRNLDYETLVIGTSMSRNFMESVIDRKMNTKSLNASIPSATAREQYLVARLALSEKKLKTVIWEINFYSLAQPPYAVEDQQNRFPYHLWDSNPLNDIQYLFSLYPVERIIEIMRSNLNQSPANRDLEMLFKFGFDNKPMTQEEFDKLIDIPNAVTRSNYQAHIMLEGFETNILPVVANNPDVSFIFFYPPYSIYWNIRADKQSKDYIREVEKTKIAIYESLSRYDNVVIYDFQDREEITFEESHYFDIAHYFPYINEWIIDAFVNEEPVQTLQEAAEHAGNLTRQVLGFERRPAKNV